MADLDNNKNIEEIIMYTDISELKEKNKELDNEINLLTSELEELETLNMEADHQINKVKEELINSNKEKENIVKELNAQVEAAKQSLEEKRVILSEFNLESSCVALKEDEEIISVSSPTEEVITIWSEMFPNVAPPTKGINFNYKEFNKIVDRINTLENSNEIDELVSYLLSSYAPNFSQSQVTKLKSLSVEIPF